MQACSAIGTDAAYAGDSQGEGLHHDLGLLVEAGLTPLQAIQSATQNTSIIVEGNKEWGSLESGKMANLLVIDGKPDYDIGTPAESQQSSTGARCSTRGRLPEPGRAPKAACSAVSTWFCSHRSIVLYSSWSSPDGSGELLHQRIQVGKSRHALTSSRKTCEFDGTKLDSGPKCPPVWMLFFNRFVGEYISPPS